MISLKDRRAAIVEPVRAAGDNLREIGLVMLVAKYGTALMARAPRVAELLGAGGEPMVDLPIEKAEELLGSIAVTAEAEKNRGYSTLQSMSVVGIWAALEAGIDDFVVEWLLHGNPAVWSPEVGKIKIPLAEYSVLSPRKRMISLLDAIKELGKARRAAGAGRFENVLSLVGLGGPISEELSRTLVEMSAVRNVSAHRVGIIDEEFQRRCPWFDKEVGEHVGTTSDDVIRYARAGSSYLGLLEVRVNAVPLPGDTTD
jgi:hypothetical protein